MQLSADSRFVVSEVESGNSEHPPLHRNHDGTVYTEYCSVACMSLCVLDVSGSWCVLRSAFLQSILVPEASEFSQWEAEGAESGCPVTAVIPVWKNLTTLDMSHNCISTIDSSVVTRAHTSNLTQCELYLITGTESQFLSNTFILCCYAATKQDKEICVLPIFVVAKKYFKKFQDKAK